MRKAIEEFIGDLEEPLRESLLLSTRHSYATCAKTLGIEAEDVGRYVDDAHELVARRLLGTTGWEDTVARQVAVMRIDQVAMLLQKRRESVWHQVAGTLGVLVSSPASALRAVTVVGLTAVAVGLAVFTWETRAPDGDRGPEGPIARAGVERVENNASGIGATTARSQAQAVGSGGGATEAMRADESTRRRVEVVLSPGDPLLGDRRVLAAAGGGTAALGGVVPRWSEVEARWREVSTGSGADVSKAEGEHSNIVRLRQTMDGFWRGGAESEGQARVAFERRLDEVLRGETGDSGFRESCAQWQFVGRSIGAREGERRRLEARRRGLEVMRGKLEREREEWEAKKMINEGRRLELEDTRERAEADRAVLEAAGRTDSEEYRRGIREYRRVVLEDYASRLDTLRTEEEKYNNFIMDTYVPGQQDYVKGMAGVLAGYSALLWGCETEWDRQLF